MNKRILYVAIITLNMGGIAVAQDAQLSGGGTVSTSSGTINAGSVGLYGQSQTFSTSSSPGSNPNNSSTIYGAGVAYPPAGAPTTVTCTHNGAKVPCN